MAHTYYLNIDHAINAHNGVPAPSTLGPMGTSNGYQDRWLDRTYLDRPVMGQAHLYAVTETPGRLLGPMLPSAICFYYRYRPDKDFIIRRIYELVIFKKCDVFYNGAQADSMDMHAFLLDEVTYFAVPPYLAPLNSSGYPRMGVFLMSGLSVSCNISSPSFRTVNGESYLDRRITIIPFDFEYQRVIRYFASVSGKPGLVYQFPQGTIPFSTRLASAPESPTSIDVIKRKFEEYDFPASLGFNDHIPIYDARDGPKVFNGDFLASLHQMPLYTGDLPANSLKLQSYGSYSATIKHIQPRMGHLSGLRPGSLRRPLFQRASPSEYTVDSLLTLSIDELLLLEDDDHIERDMIGSVLFRRVQAMICSFGLPPVDFMYMLKFSQSVVSGSSVLVSMFPGTFTPGDIDVYVSDVFKTSVLGFLFKNGYSRVKLVYPWIQRAVPGSFTTFYPPSGHPPFPPTAPLAPAAPHLPPHLSPPSTAPLNKGTTEEIIEVYELNNDAGQKVNVIVSVGKAVLPILRFHSTSVMHYISYHGVVVLHRLTLARIGIKNLPSDSVSSRTKQCYAKYEQRGFRILDRTEDVHVCEVDSDCLQTARSLFDKHVEHFVFPAHQAEDDCCLRQEEAGIMRWRSAAASNCAGLSAEKHGFYICDDKSRVFEA
ncbi:hypothetical protein DFP72DRAFT_1081514 [Ephemerocybe angulata]|uniref:Uncharacterized protein n=1 Tax=Ephemerocybe angulata TaxID=980116 RepID=A0A8H6HBD6_9AGAR|nr:hypothetical protein DFP72DRAFT_1081514 [Tulosesus angulatus]